MRHPEALVSMERYGLDGIGFVFRQSDPYTGIDLNKRLDPETGKLRPWARHYVDLFKSYIEIIPSGEGLHTIMQGRKPGGFKSRKEKIEAYDRDSTEGKTSCRCGWRQRQIMISALGAGKYEAQATGKGA